MHPGPVLSLVVMLYEKLVAAELRVGELERQLADVERELAERSEKEKK